MIRKTERKLTYPVALLLSSPSRKTFESLGREAGVSGDFSGGLDQGCECSL